MGTYMRKHWNVVCPLFVPPLFANDFTSNYFQSYQTTQDSETSFVWSTTTAVASIGLVRLSLKFLWRLQWIYRGCSLLRKLCSNVPIPSLTTQLHKCVFSDGKWYLLFFILSNSRLCSVRFVQVVNLGKLITYYVWTQPTQTRFSIWFSFDFQHNKNW